MARPPAKDLTERELEVMHVFWKRERSDRRRAPRPPRRRRAGSGVHHGRHPRAHSSGEGLSAADERGTAVPLRPSPVLRRGVGASAGRRAATGVPRLAGTTARSAGGTTKAYCQGTGRPRRHAEGAGPRNELGGRLAWSALQTTRFARAASALLCRSWPGERPASGRRSRRPRPGRGRRRHHFRRCGRRRRVGLAVVIVRLPPYSGPRLVWPIRPSPTRPRPPRPSPRGRPGRSIGCIRPRKAWTGRRPRSPAGREWGGASRP